MRSAFDYMLWLVASSLLWTRGQGWVAPISSGVANPSALRRGGNVLRPVPGELVFVHDVPRVKEEGKQREKIFVGCTWCFGLLHSC